MWAVSRYRGLLPSSHRALLATAAPAADLSAGTLVAVRGTKFPKPLLLTKPDGKRNWRAQDATGRLISLRPADVAYVLPRGLEGEQAQLIALQCRAEAESEEDLLQLAWESVEPKSNHSVEELADALFGEKSPEECYVAFYLLATDHVYFKRKGDFYEARTELQVTQLRAKLEAERAKQARIEHLSEMARDAAESFAVAVQAVANKPQEQRPSEREWLEGDHAAAVEALQESVVQEQNGRNEQVERLLIATDCSKYGTLGMLQSVGAWGAHELIHTKRLGVTNEFPLACVESVVSVEQDPPADADAALRRDLRHLRVYTIDDASTTDIDDGLSVEVLEDGNTRVWIHIADPTRYVPLGSPLDIEARNRATTVYLPTGPVHMFPKELATGPFSLNLGTERCAMSVSVDLDDQGSVVSCAAAPSHIVATHKVSYDEVNELLQMTSSSEEPELHALFAASEARHSARLRNGAVDIRMPELEVKVEGCHLNDPDIHLSFDPPSAFVQSSRSMVTEMMILCGEAIGRIGDEAGIPLPYRGQAAPVLPSDTKLLEIPEGAPRAVALRRCFTRGVLHASAAIPHGGLGLDHYVQFSSPIRRYTDMLAHYQIKAHLRGDELPFNASEMQLMMEESADVAFMKRKLTQEAEKYFITMYFRDSPQAVWDAQFLQWIRQREGLASVLIEDIGYEAKLRLDTPLDLGERISVQVLEASARLDGTTSLEFKLVEESN